MSIWDDIKAESLSPQAQLARELIKINEEIEGLEVARDAIVEKLKEEFDQEFGDQERVFDGYVVRLSTGERWSWDQDQLRDILAQHPEYPDFVKEKLTVDRRLYERLSADVQATLKPALTRKFGQSKLTVEKPE